MSLFWKNTLPEKTSKQSEVPSLDWKLLQLMLRYSASRLPPPGPSGHQEAKAPVARAPKEGRPPRRKRMVSGQASVHSVVLKFSVTLAPGTGFKLTLPEGLQVELSAT